MKPIAILILAATIILTSCKKDPVKEEPALSLQGKWSLESTIIKSYENNALVTTVNEPGNGATFDFQTSGDVVMSHDGVIESHKYTIAPDSKVDIEGYVYEIRNLAAHSVTLFLKDEYSPGNYAELEQAFKR
jgi:hypothetical protein